MIILHGDAVSIYEDGGIHPIFHTSTANHAKEANPSKIPIALNPRKHPKKKPTFHPPFNPYCTYCTNPNLPKYQIPRNAGWDNLAVAHSHLQPGEKGYCKSYSSSHSEAKAIQHIKLRQEATGRGFHVRPPLQARFGVTQWRAEGGCDLANRVS